MENTLSDSFQQERFDPDNYKDRKTCLKARYLRVKQLREKGYTVKPWTLTNQERGYSGFGTVKDTSKRNVYYLNIFKG